MGIKFEDGGFIDANDWSRIKRIIAEKARQSGDETEQEEAKPQPKITEIKSKDGVTIKVGNLELRKKPKIALANENYVSGEYKGWTIRVWRIDNEEVFGCNYFRGEDVRYTEASYGDYRDENGVFKLAKHLIDQIKT